MDVADWLERSVWNATRQHSARTRSMPNSLPTLAADDLREIRITSFGHRRQQLAAIAKAADGQADRRFGTARRRCGVAAR